MSAQQKKQQQQQQQPQPLPSASRWAFLSQAVASVESRLDNILGDEEDATQRAVQRSSTPKDLGTTSRASSDLSRSDSTNRNHDRLQARLAQAMAKKSTSRVNSPAPASEPVSGMTTPALENRLSVDKALVADATKQGETAEISTESKSNNMSPSVPVLSVTEAGVEEEQEVLDYHQSQGSKGLQPSPLASQRVSNDSARLSREAPSTVSTQEGFSDVDASLLNAQIEHEGVKSQMQEELNTYIERLDALHAKLQYLTKEAAASARSAASAAGAGTMEQKLAEKDEKIALLMEEGQKLSKSEMKHLTIIKKLRTQTAMNAKDEEAARQRAQRAEKSLAALEEKLKKTEAANRRVEERLSTVSKSSGSIDGITKERNALNATLAEVRAQLARANKRAEAAESQAYSEKLEAEKKRNAELHDDLSSAKVERELAEDKLRREMQDLRTSLEREKEQTRLMETEMLAEQAALESKLESFRTRVEEVSSGDHGDTHAKLLRQVETLQSQYAAAGQNWQGIESTLLARITSLEKERDEAADREADLRRKLRETSVKAKNNARELEDTQHHLASLQDGHADTQAESRRLSRQNEQLEEELASLRKEAGEQKVRFERDLSRRIEEEKAKWTASLRTDRTASPTTSSRKTSTFDTVSGGIVERPLSRRSSVQPTLHDVSSPSRQYTLAAMRGLSNGAIPETPSIGASLDQDEFFASMPPTPASATHADSGGRDPNDIISASTAAAGPSVQLVERMSANVRRLESEKAASKDEIARLSVQRDEARQQLVTLMREVEQKRSADERLTTLEEEHKALGEKHQATLEMLGEKTERVEELQADIIDVKQMYRQLADTMGK